MRFQYSWHGGATKALASLRIYADLLEPLSGFRTQQIDAVLMETQTIIYQSELPRPIPWNSMESDYGCTSRIYFHNAGDNVTLTLYNLTLTSQNHVNTITSVIAAKQTA